MMRYKSLPIRINTAIVVIALVIAILFGLFLYPLEIRRAEDQVERINLLLDTIFRQKLNDLANELFARQERALWASLDDIAKVDDVLGAAIYLPDGTTFISNHRAVGGYDPGLKHLQSLSGSVFERLSYENASVGVYLNRIEVIGQVVGYIAIYYDFTTLDREIWQSVYIFSCLLAATVLLMGGMLNRFLFRSIIKPVSLLRNAMHRVEAGGLGETVDLPRTDEIGDMGAAFNDMSIRLQQVHKAHTAAEEKYRSIFENATEGIFQCTPGQGRFLTVNNALSAMLGYRSGEKLIEAITHIGSELFLSRSDAIRFESELQSVGRTVGFETTLCRRDDGTIMVSISARRVKDEFGEVQYIEGSVVDITERRQREEAERKQEAAEAANRAKSQFLAYMSHEIRTPINAILGFADILDSTENGDRRKHYVQIIKSSGTNLLQLINDILDLSKIEAGRMEIQPIPVNLVALFNELYNIFSFSAMAKGLALTMDVSEAMPPRMLLDKVRLRQVLFNLIGNAVKYTTQGAVDVLATAMPSPQAHRWELVIEVKDTGIGIDSDAHEEVFKSFRQHRSSTTRQAEGTGLGLRISKNLVEMMGGSLTLQSQAGSGSVFSITLPEVQEADPAGREAAYEGGIAPPVKVDFDPATVLVADDLEINRQLIIEAFCHSPLSVVEATNGKEAISLAKAKRPDIILMDIKMPEMDGHAAMAQIRDDPDLAMIPVIALTASGMKEDIERITQSGFDDYLIRPFSSQQLLSLLTRFLPHAPQRSAHHRRTAGQPTPQRPAYLKPWCCPETAARLLKGDLRIRWEQTLRKQRIPDIRDFGQELLQLGKKFDLVALEQYGGDLCRHADNFQINKIQTVLGCYEKMLSMIGQ